MIDALHTLVVVGIVISAFMAMRSERVLSSVIALGITGVMMSLEFLLLHAPDVALSEAAVGAVLTTIIYLIAIRKVTRKGDEEK